MTLILHSYTYEMGTSVKLFRSLTLSAQLRWNCYHQSSKSNLSLQHFCVAPEGLSIYLCFGKYFEFHLYDYIASGCCMLVFSKSFREAKSIRALISFQDVHVHVSRRKLFWNLSRICLPCIAWVWMQTLPPWFIQTWTVLNSNFEIYR